MAKTAADFSKDFTFAEMNHEDGTAEKLTIYTGEKAKVGVRNFELNAENTKDSNKIEVKSEAAYVKAMAVKDGVTVMGGGSHVIAEASRNRATGSVSGDNAKMAIQTENATASFHSNCPNARCTATVSEPKSQAGNLKDSILSKLPFRSLFWRSDDQKAPPNYKQSSPEVNYNTSSSREGKRKLRSSKDPHKSHN